jgi:hypothetical protein
MKRSIILVLAVALFGCLPQVFGQIPFALASEPGVPFTCTTNDGAITLTRYLGSDGTVTIPNTIGDMPVTSIGINAFYSTSVTNVTIPDSVTSIGNRAFSACGGLANVTIGSGVTNIGYTPFDGCASLTAITVNVSNSVYSSLAGVLFNKDQTALIQYPAAKAGSYTIPSGVTTIGYQAFVHCASLTGVMIPDSVTTLGDQAFYACTSLSAVTIPDSVTNAAELAFVFCSGLTSATVGNGVTSLNGTFSDCPNLISVTLGNSVTNLDGTFVRCANLTNVMIPESVTRIGHMAFAGCTRLGNVTIPSSITTIGDSAFSACSSMTRFTIPDSVTSIGNYAFHYCTSLTGGTIGNGVTNVGACAFKNCSGLTDISIPDGVTGLGEQMFAYCGSLGSVTIGKGVTYLDAGMFSRCGRLTAITVDALNTAFSSEDGVLFNKGRTRLIEYPEGRVGTYTIPNTVTNIGNYAFQDCTGLSGVTIPGSVSSIGSQAFYSCASLTSVTIPASVTLGDNAFSSCNNLTNVYFKGDAPSDGFYFSNDPHATIYRVLGTAGWGTMFAGRPVVLWNPQMPTRDASFGVGANGFGFTLTVTNNLVIVIEACTNLTNPVWCPLQTNTLSGESLYFNDPQWTNYPGRFYRLRSL